MTALAYTEKDYEGLSPEKYNKIIDEAKRHLERVRDTERRNAQATWKLADTLAKIPLRTLTDHYGVPATKVADDLNLTVAYVRLLVRAVERFPKDSRLGDIGPSIHLAASRAFDSPGDALDWMEAMVDEYGRVRLADVEILRGGEGRHPVPDEGRSADWPAWDGWRIAAAMRDRAGLTQTEVATKAKLSRKFVSDLESGRLTNPGIRAVLAYTKAVGAPPTALIEG